MTDRSNSDEDFAQCLSELESFGTPELFLSDSDLACVLLPDLDYRAQLIAIRTLLGRNEHFDTAIAEESRQLEQHARQTKGLLNEHIVDMWVDCLHESTYQKIAHSMAAVGMLAPLIETIFHQAFQAMFHHRPAIANQEFNHKRWQQSVKDQWDCHFVWEKGRRNKDLVKGILQLAEAVELTPYLPDDLEPTLQALFGYRNKMFHCGFEWPVEERQRFAKRIDESGWPVDWFVTATTGGEPWIFYLTDIFTSHCFDLVESVIEGLGAYAREKLAPLQ